MSRRKYLTEEKFEEWEKNDFYHLVKKVIHIEGILWVLVPLVITILGIVIAVLVTQLKGG